MTDADFRDLETLTKYKLQQHVTGHNLTLTLEQAVEFVATKTGTEIQPEWSELDQIGIHRDTRVQLRRDRGRGDQILRHALRQASNTAIDSAGFEVFGDAIVVSSHSHLSQLRKQRLVVRVYYIGDILDVASRTECNRRPIPATPPQIFDEIPISERDKRAEEIQILIQTTVGQAGDWESFGGDLASVTSSGNFLAVKAPRAWHPQITELLAEMRRALKAVPPTVSN